MFAAQCVIASSALGAYRLARVLGIYYCDKRLHRAINIELKLFKDPLLYNDSYLQIKYYFTIIIRMLKPHSRILTVSGGTPSDTIYNSN